MPEEVDLDLLEETAGGLRTISNEFGESGDIPGWYDVGSDKIKDALDGFSDEWRIHKEKMKGDIDNALGLVQGALEGYQRWDQQLADALQAPPAGGPGGGP